MRSKFFILLVTAAFLLGTFAPIIAHDGKINNLVIEPDEADEHPWGGGNENDDPDVVYTTVSGPVSVFGNDAMISFGVNVMWISIKHIFWTSDGSLQPGADVKSDGSAISIPKSTETSNSNDGLGMN